MADVFLSYSSIDREIASALADAMARSGLNVWWDRDISPGREFSEQIATELSNAYSIVVVWSQNSIISPWVRDEAAEGCRRKILVPISVDTTTPPLGFRQLQTLHLSRSCINQNQLAHLCEVVSKVVDSERRKRGGYTTELVLCIDATGSMSPTLHNIKMQAAHMLTQISGSMEKMGKPISEFRVRCIAFRNIFVEIDDVALSASPFYKIPMEFFEFSKFLFSLKAMGGGESAASGLEALSIAIRSPWSKNAVRSRKVIMLWTDSEAHQLERRSISNQKVSHPLLNGIDNSLSELYDTWYNDQIIDSRGKRLLIFAPDVYPWREITELDATIHYVSDAGSGLSELDLQSMIDMISRSIY